MASRDSADTGNRTPAAQEGWELVLHLYRIFPLQITFPDITKRQTRRELVQQVMGFQEEFLRKMHAFQEGFMNFHEGMQQVRLRIKTFQGYKERTIRELRKDHPDLIKLYYDTFDHLIDLYPHLPPVRFIIPDHEIVSSIRSFEREAATVYIEPLKTIAQSFIADIYRIWTEDGSVYLPTYLGKHVTELDKTELVRLKLRMVGPLEPKAIFNGNYDPERICNLINAIQGQIGGHVNRLFGLIKGDELATYLRDSLQRVKERILPEVMTSVRPDLEEGLAMEGRFFNKRGAKERVCIKDDLMENARHLFGADCRFQEGLDVGLFGDLDAGIAQEGLRRLFVDCEIQLPADPVVGVVWKGREWMLSDLANVRYILCRERQRLEVFVESHLNRAYRLIYRLLNDDEGTVPTAEIVQTIVGLLEKFARRTREFNAGTLAMKHTQIRAELRGGLPLIRELLDRYGQACDKAYEAIHPFMGMVSFSPGGMSDFYVKWFAGLKNFLEFEIPLFRERARTVPQARGDEERVYANQEEIAEQLVPIITPDLAAGIEYALLSPPRDEEELEDEASEQLSATDLAELLADYFCLISYVHRLPWELYRIERDLFYNLRKKRTFALELIRHGNAGKRRR
ncbi:MAG: hypothetical protein HOC74_03645 [Gemmatimonadetes bacterium]|nr:hypothetical protein [Gemmatimonadota bacterium]